MQPITIVRTSTISKTTKDKACQLMGCPRPAESHHLPLCHVHRERGRLWGVPWAKGSLTVNQRRPYTGATYAWLRKQIRTGGPLRRFTIRTPSVLAVLSELTAFLKTCAFIRLDDIARPRISADRKARAILANIYRRWPSGHAAAMAILSTVIVTRLACEFEPGLTKHPRFTRAMLWLAILNLASRERGTGRTITGKRLARPGLRGKHVHTATERLLVLPFARWITDDTKAMERAILVNVTQHRYPRINWKYLEGKTYVRKQRSQRV